MHMKQLVILMGPPGSGKGSLSRILVDDMGWIQLSTGNLCRFHIAQQTSIGKEIDLILRSGKLVHDELIASMVESWIAEQPSDKTMLLDGYPRTVEQARLLLDMAKSGNYVLKIFDFIVPDQVIIDRLAHRIVCSNKSCQAVYSDKPDSTQRPVQLGICDVCSAQLIRRSDDDVAAVAERLRIYHVHVQELINFFATIGLTIHQINGNQSIDMVYRDFVAQFNQISV